MRKLLDYFRSFPPGKAIKMFFFFGFKKLLNPDAKVFYSQHGEDGIILNLIGKKNGFYIDVGCNHPVKESNTFHLYVQQGWVGINIDANESLTNTFRNTRKGDDVICAAVSDTEQEIDFYEFNCDTISTISTDKLVERQKRSDIKSVKRVKTQTLTDILNQKQVSQPIDLLTIDVEGHDLNVLKSLDLNRYRPRLIVIEIEDFDFFKPLDNEVVSYLHRHDYRLEAFDSKNGYFLSERRQALWH